MSKIVSNSDWKEIDEKWYCYDNGQPIKGEWVEDSESRWYYLDAKDGAMQTGWFQTRFNNHWFYAYKESIPSKGIYTGMIVQDKTIEIDSKSYSFNSEGHWIENVNTKGLSIEGAKFIESWEGFTNTWEDVGDGFWTIGIGTATSGNLGKKLYNQGIRSCTHEDAYKWLIEECEECSKAILSKKSDLKQNELDALISLSYNIGTQALLDSTLFRNILNGVTDADTIKNSFLMWNKCNKKVWDGLTRRRESESKLFLNSDYTRNI